MNILEKNKNIIFQKLKRRLMNFINKNWRILAKALGEKASKDNKEADKIALIRLVILITYIITNIFIICGVIRHW